MTTTVTMLQTRQGEGGSLWTVGNSYAASDAFATVLINLNYATGTLPKSRGLVPVNAQTDSNGQITALVDPDGNVVSLGGNSGGVANNSLTVGTNLTSVGQVFATIPDATLGHWMLPNVNAFDGQHYIGSAGQYGDVCGSLFLDASPLRASKAIFANFGTDDHNCSIGIPRNDGQVLTAYAGHNYDNLIHMRVGGAGGWGPEYTIEASGLVSYVQIFQIAGIASMHMFYRVDQMGWMYRYSGDQGRTWKAEVFLTNKNYMLARYSTDNVTLRCAAYDHPVTGTNHDIYYFAIYTTSGDITIPGPTVRGNTGLSIPANATNCPVPASQFHLAVDVSGATSTRLFDISDGTPCILAAEFTNDSDCNYYRYLYSAAGVPFTRKLIRAAGAPFYSASKYFGGMCFGPDQNTVIVAYKNGATWYLDKMVTADAGDSWTTTNLASSANIIMRPYRYSSTKVAYAEVASYTDYQNFSGASVKVINFA